MPVYQFKAKQKDGETIFGSQKARSQEELAKLLLQKSLLLVSVDSEEKHKKSIFSKKVSLTDKMMFTRHLAVMISAGFPFDKSLNVLCHQAENPTFKKIISDVEQQVIKGQQFSEALRNHIDVFGELYINMVKVGEETGTLKEVLENLANQMKKDHDVRGKVKGAMMYPAILVSLMTIVGTLMIIFILPKFSKLFNDMGVELPIFTQIIMGFADILAKFWYLLPVVVFFIGFGFLKIKKTKGGTRAFDKVVLKLPSVGPLFKKLNTARTARILSSLIKSGVPIVKSLDILSSTLTNVFYKEAIKEAANEIQKGNTLKQCLSKYENIFPYLLIQMVEVGEETGNLGAVLEELADFFEGEVDNTTKNLSTIIEPVLMVIIGIAVAVFALSVLQPLYSIMGSL
jgi:type IV pilus assembly protein PilC